MENDHRNSGFSQLQNGGSFHSYVKLPEGISWKPTSIEDETTSDFFFRLDLKDVFACFCSRRETDSVR